MSDQDSFQKIREYWGREQLAEAILEALAASGKDLEALTVDDSRRWTSSTAGGSARPSGWLSRRSWGRACGCWT